MKKPFLECGKIINTHGVDGAVKVESWCDTPQKLANLKRVYFADGEGYRETEVLHASVFKQFVIMTLEGVADIDAAAALRERVIFAARDSIATEPGDIFIADLIGLPVIDADNGREYGKITDVTNRGASDIYIIGTPDGERMMPAVAEFVKKIDTDTAVYVSPIEGMFD